MKWRWALLLAAAASLQLQAEAAAEQGALTHTRAHAHAHSALRAPRPDQYLLISSPREQKVCFSRIHPGASAGTSVKPLVDSGLMAPEGIAVDRKRGKLYVADPPVQKVFQYSVEIRGGELLSDNRQITIAEGIEVHWLAVDQLGDLYFTGSVDNSVMTIPLATLQQLESGVLKSSNLKTESEAAEAAAKAAAPKPEEKGKGKEEPKKGEAPKKGEKGKAPAGKPADRPLDDLARLDIRVGKIVKVWPHPDADKLWCEEIDLGEGQPRTIASGLREYVPEAEMLNARVVVLCNLKPKNMRGFASQGMVMCASSPEKVELLRVPEGVPIGERITCEGFSGDPDEKLNEKPGKAPLEVIFPELKTNADAKPAACYKGVPLMTSKGPLTAPTLKSVFVK